MNASADAATIPMATTSGRVRRAAVAAAAGFVGLVGFQIALALGAPLGRAAWGGGSTYLSTGLRLSSALAAVFWTLAALVVLRRAGFRVPVVSPGFAMIGTWVLVALLPLGAIMNLASSSDWERFGWGPVAATLAVLCLIVARNGRANSAT